MLLKKSDRRLSDEVVSLFAEIIRQKLLLRDRDNRVRPLEQDLEKSRAQLAESLERQTALNIQLTSLTARLDEATEEHAQLKAQRGSASTQLHTLSKSSNVGEISLQDEATGFKRKLDLANQRLNEILASPGWKVIRRYRGWVEKSRRAHPRLFGYYENLMLRMLRLAAGQPDQQSSLAERGNASLYSGAAPGQSSEALTEPHMRSQERPCKETSKFLLIISGCPGDAYRYRAEHQAEELHLLGLTVDTALFDAVDYDCVLHQYSAFLLHRVPHTTFVADFIEVAKRSGKPVIFDTDDLVFNEKFIKDIKALRDFPADEKNLYIDGVRRYYRTLSLCHAALVSTESLRDRIKELFPEMPVYVNRNAVSDEMVRQADFALKRFSKIDDGSVRIIYMSGTRTHNEDFAQCVAALDRLLQAHSQVRLMIVGHLDVPERLHRWRDRLEIIPLVPWQELPRIMRRADINLAPLELENAFTQCKSELKYFEAGLLGLPTVASQVTAFQFAITPGENGFFCRSEQDWFDAIERLVLSPVLRCRIGSSARQDVLARYTTRSRAPELTKALRQIFDDLRVTRPRRLSIAVVTRAPIAQTEGGYKNIFALANRLANRGHDVHIYVEAIAHLAALTDSEILAFCHRHFGSSAARVHVGHDQILPSDVALATNYPTAYTVNNLTTAKCKAYFIQDFEPDFYDRSEPEYERAEQTYDLPLKKIVLGKYLQTVFSKRDRIAVRQVPFSLDLSIFRNLEIRQRFPIRVLFFARPGLKRRAYPVGVEALRIVASACPEVKIAFYGMKEPEDLGFAYHNLGELSPEQVASEMNRSHLHLSFSLTNISWVPFEAMACGCAVVEAKVPSIEAWMGDESESCVLVEPNARAVADALIKLIRDPKMRDSIARAGEKYVEAISATWEDSCEQLEKILLEAVFRDSVPTEGIPIASRTGGFSQKVFSIDDGKRRWSRDPL
jgi:glycosyltransferase involved in cell wall biosynthesis/regulator of replication initiation timing